MNDVDDEAVTRSPHAQRSWAHKEADDVEEVGKVPGDVKAVVERQHEQVPGQDGDVVPVHVLLQKGSWRSARSI